MADRRTVEDILRAIGDFGASPREALAAKLAPIVESGVRPLRGGDRDSTGAYQQRPSQGWGAAGEGAYTDATQFLRAARKLSRQGFKGSAGQLAQAVQRSAYPDRYDKVRGQVAEIFGGATSVGRRGGSSNSAAPGLDLAAIPDLVGLLNARQPRARASMASVPARPAFAAQAVLPEGFQPQSSAAPAVDAQQPSFEELAQQIAATAQRQAPESSPESSPPAAGAPAGGSGGLSPLLELYWQGPGGINVKDGKVVPQGFVKGHADHAHAAAGPKTIKRFATLAQEMGLHIGENAELGDQVDPVHASGSYHYRRDGRLVSSKQGNQAIDVSGDPEKVAAWARQVARLYGLGAAR